METIFAISAFMFGSIVGSFLNVCIYRIPRNLSIIKPRSFCPNCKKTIPFYLNIPILGYFITAGRCFNCKEPISFRYPLVEFFSAFFTLEVYIKYGFSPVAFKYLLFVYALLVVIFIDIDSLIIPDRVTLPGILLSIPFALIDPAVGIKSALLGIVVGGGFFFAIAYFYLVVRKIEALGGGDVKLMAMIGGFVGITAIPFVVVFASLQAILVGLFQYILMKFDLAESYLNKLKEVSDPEDPIPEDESSFGSVAIPFGPFLAIAVLEYLFIPGIQNYMEFLSRLTG